MIYNTNTISNPIHNRIDNFVPINLIVEKDNNSNSNNDTSIGKLIIDKININNKLYNINDKNNNVDKNITILKESIFPDKDNSIMFIAAHSGTGKVAYFKDLDKLTYNDEITLIIHNKTYKYIVKDIWETDKDGDIEVSKSLNKQLILTTCSPSNKDKQLIINCTIKEF